MRFPPSIRSALLALPFLLNFTLAGDLPPETLVCPGLAKTRIGNIFLVHPRSSYVNPCAYLAEVDATFEKVADLFPEPKPPPVTIALYARGDQFGYWNSGELLLTQTWGEVEKFPDLAEHVPTVISHEYAHHFFLDRLSRLHPELSEYLDLLRVRSTLMFERERIQSLATAAERQAGAIRVRSLQSQESKLTERLVDHRFRLLTTIILPPYTELYADVIATLARGNPTAIARALQAMQVSRAAIESSSFAKEVDPSTWGFTQRHMLLTPTRGAIGKDWKANPPRSPEARRAWVQRINSAMDAQISAHWNAMQLEPREANLSLIRALKPVGDGT